MNRLDFNGREWTDLAERHTNLYRSRRPQVGDLKQWHFWYQMPKKFVKAKREPLSEHSWYALYYRARLKRNGIFAYTVPLYGDTYQSGAKGFSQGPAKGVEHQRYAM